MMNWIGRPWLPGSGGGWNATTCAPAIFAMRLLHQRLQHVGGARALVPRLQHHAGDVLAGHVELEDVVGLGIAGEVLVDLPVVQHRAAAASNSAALVAEVMMTP